MCIDGHFIKVKTKKKKQKKKQKPKVFFKIKKKRSQPKKKKKKKSQHDNRERKNQRKRSQNINRERKNQSKKRANTLIEKGKNQRKKKKKAHTLEVKSNVKGIFGSSFHELPSLSFLPILERKLFCRLEEKTHRSHHLFFFLLIQSNILQKKISSHFLSKVFNPPYFTSKQTHPRSNFLVVIYWVS